MKEWKKPFCKVVVLDDADVVTSSSGKTSAESNVSIDNAGYKNQSNGNIWGRQ